MIEELALIQAMVDREFEKNRESIENAIAVSMLYGTSFRRHSVGSAVAGQLAVEGLTTNEPSSPAAAESFCPLG